jgi:hypothetical protein
MIEGPFDYEGAFLLRANVRNKPTAIPLTELLDY